MAYVAATAALAAVLVEGVLGAIVVYHELQGALVLAHLAVALVILGLLVAVAVVVQPLAGAASRPAGAYLAAAVAATYAILLTGSGVVAAGADEACRSWPSCGNGVAAPVDGLQAINLGHRLVVAIGGLFLVYVLSLNVRGAPSIRTVAAALTLAALALQVAVGALTAIGGETPLFNGLHLALATAVWSGVVLVAACGLRASPDIEQEPRLALKGHTA